MTPHKVAGTLRPSQPFSLSSRTQEQVPTELDFLPIQIQISCPLPTKIRAYIAPLPLCVIPTKIPRKISSNYSHKLAGVRSPPQHKIKLSGVNKVPFVATIFPLEWRNKACNAAGLFRSRHSSNRAVPPGSNKQAFDRAVTHRTRWHLPKPPRSPHHRRIPRSAHAMWRELNARAAQRSRRVRSLLVRKRGGSNSVPF